MKKFLWLLPLVGLLAACGDREIPENNHNTLEKEPIIGVWTVESTEVYLVVPEFSIYKPMIPTFENMLRGKLLNNGSNKILCFTNEKLYRFSSADRTLEDSSAYYIGKDTLHFTNPRIMSFYAEYFYGKFDTADSSLFTGYLRKKEVIALVRDDYSVANYASIFESALDDAQCEIRFRKGSDEEYNNLISTIFKKD